MKKEYKLKTLKQVCEVVNDKNFNLFILDFVKWLSIQVVIKKSFEGIEITDKNFGIFHWIDDGKNEVKIEVEIK